MPNPRNPQPSPIDDDGDTGEAGELDNRHLYRDDREPDTDYENEYPSNREW